MTYVKLTAKPDTWFVAGTEVYHYDEEPLRRLTKEEWDEWQTCIGILVRGRRVADGEHELKLFGPDERWDGEMCSQDEFEVEMVEEAR